MSGVTRRGGRLVVVALLCCASVPAQAAMGCWNETQVAAANVRDFQSRLMVATMRCRARGIDILYAYNRFVIANRDTLRGANGVLRSQFLAGYGSDGELQYDRFTTSLANAYGGDDTDPWVCAETEDLAYEAADARGDVQRLLALANRSGAHPRLPGGRCEISFDRGEADTVASAGFEPIDPAARDRFERNVAPPVQPVEATPVPRDRWDEVEAIPAPSSRPDDFEVERAPAVPRYVKPAPKVRHWYRI